MAQVIVVKKELATEGKKQQEPAEDNKDKGTKRDNKWD